MNRKLSLVRLGTTLGIAALTSSVALPQSYPEAAEGSAPAETSAASAGMHCVAELAPVSAGASEYTVARERCYKTFAAAMAAASHNTVVLSPDASPQSLREADLAPLAALSIRDIGMDYDGTSYSGASQTWLVNNYYGCTGGHSYKANMPISFDNRLSSTRAFTGCGRNVSYDLPDQRGDRVRCFSDCLYIGGLLDNRTSSKRWQP